MNKTLCVKTLLTLCFAALLFVGPSFAQDTGVFFDWSQSSPDPNGVGSEGSLFAVVQGILFEGPMPTPTFTQLDSLFDGELFLAAGPNGEGVVGWANGPGDSTQPGTASPGGFRLDWGGNQTVQLTATKEGISYTFDVTLKYGSSDDNRNRWGYTFAAFDNGAADPNHDVKNGVNRWAAWVGDEFDGHRHSANNNESYTVGQDYFPTRESGSTGGNANNDDLAVTFALRNIAGYAVTVPPTPQDVIGGSIFVGDLNFHGQFVAATTGQAVSPKPPPSFEPVLAFEVTVDIGPQLQRVDPGHVELPINFTAPVLNDGNENIADAPITTASGVSFVMAINRRNKDGFNLGSVGWRDLGDGVSSDSLVKLGEDMARNNNGPIRLTFSQLPAGDYTMTSYHRDANTDRAERIEVYIDTGAGFVLQTDPNGADIGNADWDDAFRILEDPNFDPLDPNSIEVDCSLFPEFCVLVPPGVDGLNNDRITETSATFSFSTSGLNPVSIIFDSTNSPDFNLVVPLNGFTLAYLPPATDPTDVNGDGVVDLLDLQIIADNMWQEDPNFELIDGDINGDFKVDQIDFRAWKDSFEAPLTAPLSASVPEPASLGIALLGAVALLGIRRRRSYRPLEAPLSESVPEPASNGNGFLMTGLFPMNFFKYTRLLLAVVIGLSFQTISHATDFEWVGDNDPNVGAGGDNFWATPFRWRAGFDPNGTPIFGLPGSSDDAEILNGGYVLYKFLNPDIDDLDLFNGTLHILEGEVPGEGILTLDPTGDSTNGDFDMRLGGGGSTTLIVEGVLDIGDDFKFRGGTTTIRGTGEMFVGNDVQNWGPGAVLTITDDAFMKIRDNFRVGAGGTMTVSGNSLVISGNNMEVDGILLVTDTANLILRDDWDVNDGGVFTVDPNATVLSEDNFDIKNGGLMIIRGTLNINDDIDVENGGTFRNSGTVTLGEFDMAPEGTYIAHLIKGGQDNIDPMVVAGEAELEGTLIVDFENASTDEVGNKWDLIKAGRLEGSFDNIIITGQKAAGLLANQGIGFSLRFTDAGFTTTFTISIAQRLELQLDRVTGAATIVNASLADPNATAPVTVGLTGYTISSALGSLNPAAWSSLASQGDPNSPDWFEIPASDPNATRITFGELNALGVESIIKDGSVTLGAPYVFDITAATEFGVEIEDVEFTFVNSDAVTVEGLVTYTGGKQSNNIVLTIDPITGNATIQNQSNFAVAIDLYKISSENSTLLTTWNSLEDQGESTWKKSNPQNDIISEFMDSGLTTLHRNNGYSLDGLFDPNTPEALRDVVLEFLLEGSLDLFTGIVVYGDLDPNSLFDPDLNEADFNEDGVVDGSDLLILQRGFGNGTTKAEGDYDNNGVVDEADLAGWKLNYGLPGPDVPGPSFLVAAVPEPTSLVLLVAGALGFAGRRRRR